MHSSSKANFVKNSGFAKTSVSVSYDKILEKFPLGSSNLAFLFSLVVVQKSNVVKYLLYSISALTQGAVLHSKK